MQMETYQANQRHRSNLAGVLQGTLLGNQLT